MFNTIADKLEKIIFIIIKGIIFLLPLFFLPWTSEYFEFNKQFMLWLAMPAALLLWLIKMAVEKEIKIKINPLNFPILIFLLFTAASSFFSLDRFSSFFGYFGRFSDAWLGLLSLVIFYFLLINSGLADSPKKIYGLVKIFIYSAVAVTLVSLLLFIKASFNPAGGSFLTLSIFLAVLAAILIGLLLNGNLKKFDRYFFNAGLALMLLALVLINFYLSWVILLLGVGLLMLFHWFAKDFNFRKLLNYFLLIPAMAILLAVFFLLMSEISLSKAVFNFEPPKEAVLANSQAMDISRQMLKVNPFLGSGPGTFTYDYSLYRPASANQAQFWQIRFDKSSSHFLEMLATSGLLTLLSYFLVISLAIYLSAVLIKKYLKSELLEFDDYNLLIVLFTAFLLLFFSQVIFFANTVLNFSFWLILGLLIAFWQTRDTAIFKETKFNLIKNKWYLRIWLLIILLAGISFLTLMAYEIKFFAADIIAASGDNRQASLNSAIKLNPYRYNYQVNLAKFYLNRIIIEADKPYDKRDNGYLQSNIALAIDRAKQTVVVAPDSVLAWETLGVIYRDIMPLTIGSESWAVDAFSRAVSLEPTNPVLVTELAKAYFNNDDSISAEKYFKQAIQLKADYYEAKFGLAKVYLKDKKDGLALNLLNELAGQVYHPEIFYELGRYYYNHGEIDKAIERFKLVLSIAPKHSNSLFSLGIAYQAKGNKAEALKYFKQVLELNPGNEDVIKKIKELEKK